MTYEQRTKWAMGAIFCVGFIAGQDYHTGLAAVLGFMIRLALWCFVIYVMINFAHTNYVYKKEAEWKAHQSQQRTKPSSKGMVRTVADAATATGTHVAVLDNPKRPAFSAEDEGRKLEHSSRPGFEPTEG